MKALTGIDLLFLFVYTGMFGFGPMIYKRIPGTGMWPLDGSGHRLQWVVASAFLVLSLSPGWSYWSRLLMIAVGGWNYPCIQERLHHSGNTPLREDPAEVLG